jgi:hypothetical protein
MNWSGIALGFSIVLCACSPNVEEGEASGPMDKPSAAIPDLAGGQSGTESRAGYDCVLDEARVEGVPLDKKPSQIAVSPDQVFDLIEGTRAFSCSVPSARPQTTDQEAGTAADAGSSVDGGSFADVTVAVEIQRGSEARLLTGKLYSDTFQDDAPVDCYVLELDATVTLRSNGESVSRAVPLRVDHLGATQEIQGSWQLASLAESKGLKFTFRHDARELFVVSPNWTTWCPALPGS